MEQAPRDRLRALPAAHVLLDTAAARDLSTVLPSDAVKSIVRGILEELRNDVDTERVPSDRGTLMKQATLRIEAALRDARIPRLRRVINATGVVLHTNLGRAPLAPEVLRHVAELSRGYATLEYDLAEGRRGHRDRLVSALCASLVGAADALVLNNNAAAVLLAVSALASGREVIVSRGELVEIGGGFRIPDILAACGARIREVGTTNRTRAEDYTRAFGPDTALLLKVHRSNFVMRGFTAEVSVPDVVALARERGVPFVHDLGSGALGAMDAYGLPSEPTARESIAAGADLVMFSGDKLLGGPQAGIIVGRAEHIASLRKHPLARAMRPGRLVFAALEATLKIHAENRAREAIPVIAMLAAHVETVRARAERIVAALRARRDDANGCAESEIAVEACESQVGGGAMPDARIASFGVAANPGAGRVAALENALRCDTEPPIIARVHAGRVWLDARTIADDEVDAVARGLAQALVAIQKERVRGGSDAAMVGSPNESPPIDEEF